MTIAKIVSGGQTGVDRGALAAYPPPAGVRDPWGSEHAERSECRADGIRRAAEGLGRAGTAQGASEEAAGTDGMSKKAKVTGSVVAGFPSPVSLIAAHIVSHF